MACAAPRRHERLDEEDHGEGEQREQRYGAEGAEGRPAAYARADTYR